GYNVPDQWGGYGENSPQTQFLIKEVAPCFLGVGAIVSAARAFRIARVIKTNPYKGVPRGELIKGVSKEGKDWMRKQCDKVPEKDDLLRLLEIARSAVATGAKEGIREQSRRLKKVGRLLTPWR